MAQRPKTSTTSRPPKPAVELLSSTLERFSTSSRYPMLQHLTVSAFVKKDAKLPKSLAQRTFGDLVKEGGTVLGGARGVTAKHVSRVIEILNSLLDGENSPEQPLAPSVTPKPAARPRWAKQPPVRVSSVEAEQKLTTALSKLRTSPRFAPIRMNRIGDYWDPDWVRAPFEEALTFEQLSQLKPQALLEKRSFTAQKLLHLVAAVDKALGLERVSPPSQETDSQTIPPSAQATGASNPGATSQIPATLVDGWRRDASELPSTVAASILLYEREAKSCPPENAMAIRLLSEIPLRITAREFITAALLEEYEAPTASSMMKTDHGTIIETSKLAYKKLDQYLRETNPGIYQSLSIALSQPATPLSNLAEILFGRSFSDAFRNSLTAIISRSLGATPIEAFGVRPAGYWSKNPHGLERTIRLLVAGLPKSDSDLKAESLTVLPGLPFDKVSELLRPLAFFNDKARSWSKRS